MDRRRFLQLSAATGAAGAGVALAPGLVGAVTAALDDPPFRHGVAAGDPVPNGFVIWTRVTPSPAATPGSGVGGPVVVAWEVATDAAFADVVRSGSLTTDAGRDHTVHVDVGGLEPATAHHYRFAALGRHSPVGRALTAPAAGSDPTSVRFGVASCSNYTGGFFSAYAHLADRDDLDFVLHLGDYLYEYGNSRDRYGSPSLVGVRDHDPDHEIVSLADYRRRHAQYKADPDLRRLHARHAFVTTWDDHEVVNDTWAAGAGNHQADEGDFATRRARAHQAYFEWVPVRRPDPSSPERIHRRLAFGRLADLHLLDLRQYRDVQPASPTDAATIDDPGRTILGDDQERWLLEGLATAGPRWRVIGNPVMITPVTFGAAPGGGALPPEAVAAVAELTGVNPVAGAPYNVDQWDGYRADQKGLLGFIDQEGIDDVVFLTGDIHSSWACDLPLRPGDYPVLSPSVAVELVGTSITSDNLDEIAMEAGATPEAATAAAIAVEQGLRASNRHVQMVELRSHGYSVCDITAERLQMDWHYLADRAMPRSPASFAQAWQVLAGTNRVVPAAGQLGARPGGGAPPTTTVPGTGPATTVPATTVSSTAPPTTTAPVANPAVTAEPAGAGSGGGSTGSGPLARTGDDASVRGRVAAGLAGAATGLAAVAAMAAERRRLPADEELPEREGR